MKEKFKKKYLRRLKYKIHGRNKIMAINKLLLSMLRYRAWILKCNNEELKRLDRKNRKTTAMHGALNLEDDVDRIYVSREMGERGLVSCKRVH